MLKGWYLLSAEAQNVGFVIDHAHQRMMDAYPPESWPDVCCAAEAFKFGHAAARANLCQGLRSIANPNIS